jgi:hypothetical protein
MGHADELRNIRRDARRDDPAAALLRSPTGAPRDLARVTPGHDPLGPALEPAPGPPPDDGQVAVDFAAFLVTHLGHNQARVDATLGKFHDPDVAKVLPDAGVRAGFLSLTGTLGDPMIEPFLAGELAVGRVAYGDPADAGRVVGPAAGAPPDERVVNRRYRAEPFPLLAGSLLHELLHHEPAVSDDEETVLHALLAAVHLQVISRTPDLAGTTELARRQNSLALALLCSRTPGSPAVRLIAPDGPGPSFWRIPFGPHVDRAVAPSPAFDLLLDALLRPEATSDRPTVIDEALAARLDEQVFTRELRPDELVRAGIALTVLDHDDCLARAAG